MMRLTVIWKSLWGICFLAGLMSCHKEDLPYYDEIPGIYFNGNYWSYSFMENPNKSSDTLKLPALISGLSRDYDRTFRVKVEPDYTSAPAELFELLDGVVKAGSFDGVLPVIVYKSDVLQDTIFRIGLSLIPTDDFTELRLGESFYMIDFTGKIIKPANWWWLHYFFGEYSTLWWSKIMEWTGRSVLPYYPGHPDQETWWMKQDDIMAYKMLVRKKLNEYNLEHPKEPLTHDDGPQAGLPVVMP